MQDITNEFTNCGLFQTNNQQLAFALASAGCSFAPQDQKGPAINVYTVEALRARKVGLGLPLERAVAVAVERQVPGNVSYLFTRTEELERCVKAWDLMVEELHLSAHEKRDPIMPEVSPEDIMRVLCIHANNREEMKKLPWFNRPLIMMSDAKTKPVDGKNITEGTAKIWSFGLSEPAKRDLKSRK